MKRGHERFDFVGSLHFITTVTLHRGDWFNTHEICSNILEWFEGYRAKHDLICYGFVLMPDHLHALLKQTSDGNPVSRAIGGFKQMTSLRAKPESFPQGSLWQSGYDDVLVPGADAGRTKMKYMHNNPVKREFVTRPEEFRWSSARWYHDRAQSIVQLESI